MAERDGYAGAVGERRRDAADEGGGATIRRAVPARAASATPFKPVTEAKTNLIGARTPF